MGWLSSEAMKAPDAPRTEGRRAARQVLNPPEAAHYLSLRRDAEELLDSGLCLRPGVTRIYTVTLREGWIEYLRKQWVTAA